MYLTLPAILISPSLLTFAYSVLSCNILFCQQNTTVVLVLVLNSVLSDISSVTFSPVILCRASRIFFMILLYYQTWFLSQVLCWNINEKTWMMHLVDTFSCFVPVPFCPLPTTWLKSQDSQNPCFYKVSAHLLATVKCSEGDTRLKISQSASQSPIYGDLGERK